MKKVYKAEELLNIVDISVAVHLNDLQLSMVDWLLLFRIQSYPVSLGPPLSYFLKLICFERTRQFFLSHVILVIEHLINFLPTSSFSSLSRSSPFSTCPSHGIHSNVI
jgi:hypothetical protein